MCTLLFYHHLIIQRAKNLVRLEKKKKKKKLTVMSLNIWSFQILFSLSLRSHFGYTACSLFLGFLFQLFFFSLISYLIWFCYQKSSTWFIHYSSIMLIATFYTFPIQGLSLFWRQYCHLMWSSIPLVLNLINYAINNVLV